MRAEVAQGVRWVARDLYFRPLTLYAALSNLAYSGNLALVVVFLVRVVGLGSLAVGLVTATGGIGGLAGALIAVPWRGGSAAPARPSWPTWAAGYSAC